MTLSEGTTLQASSTTATITQPVITQPTSSAVMTYSTNTVAAYKPALLPTPAAAMATPTAATAASQLDPYTVAAAAALLLARLVNVLL